MSSSFLNGAICRLSPHATVEPLPCTDAWRVSRLVTAKELASSRAEPAALLRNLSDNLTPRRTRKRRLHWGHKH